MEKEKINRINELARRRKAGEITPEEREEHDALRKEYISGFRENLQAVLDSVVIRQYGRQIRKVINETLNRLDVTDAKITVVDKGALDCTIKARVECAVYRSNDIKDALPWGGAIK